MAPDPQPDDRRGDRIEAYIDAQLGPNTSVTYAAALLDVSQFGFRVMVDDMSSEHSVVWLKLRGVEPLMARVVWAEGATLGCEFAHALSADELAQITKRTIAL